MTCCVSVAAVLLLSAASMRSDPSVHTVLGTGIAGHSDRETTTPFGFAVGPDGALYFCEMDGQRVRRLDRATKHVTTIAGTGERGYSGDGGAAVAAALNMPHELQFDAAGDLYIADRDSHTIRRIDMKTGIISTAVGTGVAGFSDDAGWTPATPSPPRCDRAGHWPARGRAGAGSAAVPAVASPRAAGDTRRPAGGRQRGTPHPPVAMIRRRPGHERGRGVAGALRPRPYTVDLSTP